MKAERWHVALIAVMLLSIAIGAVAQEESEAEAEPAAERDRHRAFLAHKPRSKRGIRFPSLNSRKKRRDILRIVLSVAIQADHQAIPVFAGELQTRLNGAANPQVAGNANNDCTRRPCNLTRTVC